jgi:hypothetical protein
MRNGSRNGATIATKNLFGGRALQDHPNQIVAPVVAREPAPVAPLRGFRFSIPVARAFLENHSFALRSLPACCSRNC